MLTAVSIYHARLVRTFYTSISTRTWNLLLLQPRSANYHLIRFFVLATGKLYIIGLLRTLNSRVRLRESMKSNGLGRVSLGGWQMEQDSTINQTLRVRHIPIENLLSIISISYLQMWRPHQCLLHRLRLGLFQWRRGQGLPNNLVHLIWMLESEEIRDMCQTKITSSLCVNVILPLEVHAIYIYYFLKDFARNSSFVWQRPVPLHALYCMFLRYIANSPRTIRWIGDYCNRFLASTNLT